MMDKLMITQIKKTEKKLIEKGCEKKTGDLWDVPLGELKIDKKFDFRRSGSSRKFKSMARDILEKGILNPPIAIYSINSDEIVLGVGFRRIKSFKKNKKDYVPCRIFISKKLTPEEIFQLIVSDNVHREDMRPIELALFYHSWMKETGLKQKELAEQIQKSETYVSDILRPLEKLSDEEIEKILTSELTRSQILEISKIDDKNLRLDLIQKKESVRKIRELREEKREVNQKDIERNVRHNPMVFEFSSENIHTAHVDAKFSMQIEFSTQNWGNEDVLEILNHVITAIRKSLDKGDYQGNFTSFDNFKEV